ncbi:unnamed protein product, partial [marine sediment metagenome]
ILLSYSIVKVLDIVPFLLFNYSFDNLALRISGPLYINYTRVLTDHYTSWLLVTSKYLESLKYF